MRPFQAEGQRHCLFSLRGRAALSLVLGALQGLLSVSLRRRAHLYEASLSAFLVTRGVPKSLSETPRSPEAPAQGGWGSRSPGRWKGRGWGRAHSPLERASQPLPTRVPKALPSARPPSRACSSPGGSGVALGQVPSSAPPDRPPLRQGPSQLRAPFLESGPLAECPPRLVWCLQLPSPPQPRATEMAPPGSPIPSPRMPFPVLARLSCFSLSLPHSPPSAPQKDFSWGRGPAPRPLRPPAMGSVLSLAMWWRRVGGPSGHRPLCAQPDLAAW